MSDLEEVLKSEKAMMHGSQDIKESLEKARMELEVATRNNELEKIKLKNNVNNKTRRWSFIQHRS